MRWLRLMFFSIPILALLASIVMCQQVDRSLLEGARKIAGTEPQELRWEIFEISGVVPVEIHRMTVSDLVALFKGSEASSSPGKRHSDEIEALFNLSVSIRNNSSAEFCYSVRVYKFDLKKVWLDRVPLNKKCGQQRFGSINRKLYFNTDKWGDAKGTH